MKTVRYFFATSVLASALCMSTFAGTIHTGAPEPEPTPTPAEGEMSSTANGVISTPGGDEATTDEVVAGALSLLQGVLSSL